MNAHDDPETLERRSDSIRADVGETLDALQRNYSPGALIDRSMDLLRDHGGEMATNVMDTVRRNPMPVLLIAAGAAWMIAAQLRSPREDDAEEAFGRGEDSSVDDDGSSYETGSYQTGSYETGSYRGSESDGPLAGAKEKLRNATRAATDTVTGGARKLSERAHNVATSARRKSQHAGESMTRLLQEQPFAVGAAGIAIGALIGAMLPETAQEDQLLGSARDRALRKARSAGKRGFESARQKIHEAVDRTTESLRGDGGEGEQKRDSEAMRNGTAAL